MTYHGHGTNPEAIVGMRRRSSALLLTLCVLAGIAAARENTAARCDIGTAITRALTELPEASGIAGSRRNPGIYWSHNDSAAPLLYALDANARVVGRVKVSGTVPVDWEDVAVASCPEGSCVYIADIGDNDSRRRDVAVHRVSEPAPDAAATAPVQTIRATYPDGPRDAEAFFVTSAGEIYIVSKTPAASLYRFPRGARPGSRVQLERVAEFPKKSSKDDERITGGAVSSDDQWVALRTHSSIRLFRAKELLGGKPNEAARIDVSRLREPQGEGVSIGAGNVFTVVSEGGAKSRPGTFATFACAELR